MTLPGLHTLPIVRFRDLPEGHYFIDCGDDGILPDWGLNCYLKQSGEAPQTLMDLTGQYPVEFTSDSFVVDLGVDDQVIAQIEVINA